MIGFAAAAVVVSAALIVAGDTWPGGDPPREVDTATGVATLIAVVAVLLVLADTAVGALR